MRCIATALLAAAALAGCAGDRVDVGSRDAATVASADPLIFDGMDMRRAPHERERGRGGADSGRR